MCRCGSTFLERPIQLPLEAVAWKAGPWSDGWWQADAGLWLWTKTFGAVCRAGQGPPRARTGRQAACPARGGPQARRLAPKAPLILKRSIRRGLPVHLSPLDRKLACAPSRLVCFTG